MFKLQSIDWMILLVYLIFVLGIGFAVKRLMKSSTDFFQSGRSLPAWVTGLAFISANLGAQEVIGMGANGAKYGIATSHFYWIGAIPAMVFVGIFMMPFYYGSKARSVPEYLKMRFDDKTRIFNAGTFAFMTVISSGVSMYALANLLSLLLKWNLNFSIWVSAIIVLVYIFMGGLTSAIYNEVLQFFLIVFGFAPLAYLGLKDIGGGSILGGWHGLTTALTKYSLERGFSATAFTHTWKDMGTNHNPMGVEWFGLTMGLGFVMSFGYWCTDFLLIQRAMAANSMSSARRTPLIAAFPKMLFPFIVILPGMIALVVGAKVNNAVVAAGKAPAAQVASAAPSESNTVFYKGLIPAKLDSSTQKPVLDDKGKLTPNYDMATPMMLLHYFPAGLLGLGLAALMASFMSGMAGNVTAFNTVWTYDIYQGYINKKVTDRNLMWMGRGATVVGIVISIAAAYLANHFNNIMDLLQLIFAFVNAPLFATFALGMFWKRSTGHGAFWGLLSGTLAAAAHHGLTLPAGCVAGFKGGWLHLGIHHTYPVEMAQNFWTALWAFGICFATTVVISVVTQPRLEADLKGLVYSLTPKIVDRETTWYKKPATLGVIVVAAALVLSYIFF
jgi:SSS family solute:Na+ symporter